MIIVFRVNAEWYTIMNVIQDKLYRVWIRESIQVENPVILRRYMEWRIILLITMII